MKAREGVKGRRITLIGWSGQRAEPGSTLLIGQYSRSQVHKESVDGGRRADTRP